MKTTAERPRLYYWSEKSDEESVLEAEETTLVRTGAEPMASLPLELSLYGPVIDFFGSEFSAFGMRIDEKTASNKKGANGNKWLFPDICAMESLIEGLDAEVLPLINLTGAEKAYICNRGKSNS